jgi:hypothetical protein
MAASIFGCAILAGCATASTSESPRDECVNYGDERVNALAWAPDGDRLALISTSLTTNESVVRAIDWPGLVGALSRHPPRRDNCWTWNGWMATRRRRHDRRAQLRRDEAFREIAIYDR